MSFVVLVVLTTAPPRLLAIELGASSVDTASRQTRPSVVTPGVGIGVHDATLGAMSAENRAGHLLPTVEGTSACPLPQAVSAALATLVGDQDLARRVGAGSPSSPVVQIFDLGVPYRVIAGDRVREYRDDRRDCAERARVAALFVALALAPPAVPEAVPEPAALPAPASPPRSRGDTGGPRHPVVEIEVGPAAEVGFAAADRRTVHLGARVGVILGRGVLAIAIGLAGLAPATTDVGGVRVRQWRWPGNVGLRARGRWGALAPYAELGLAGVIYAERAPEVAMPESRTAMELGAHAVAGLRVAQGARLAPYVAATAELVPSPTTISALPRGVIGHNPNLWLGATAGASIDF